MKIKLKLIFSLLLLTSFYNLQAIELPKILSDNMVLQSGKKVTIWGNAEPNESISVRFKKQNKKTKSNAEGKWSVSLDPLEASAIPAEMEIKGNKEKITLKNILVGEVWFCSGQSNMEYRMKLIPQFALPLKGEDLAAKELKKTANPMIRVFNRDRKNNKNSWQLADSISLVNTSAAGYFFGKSIQTHLNVPVGIITSAIGGTRIEGWTTKAAYEKSTIFASQLLTANGKIDGYGPGEWYKTMIEPLAPFTVKGFLWYQGENNCGVHDRQYAEKYQIMVDSWRLAFNVPDAPFYSVLLAPHIYSDRLHKGNRGPVTAEELPIFREQQIKAQKLIANTEYISVSDLVDNLKDIHPSYKWTVGERLARVALAKTYGKDTLIWSGPRFLNTQISGNSVIVQFDHVGKGLRTNDDKRLLWFEIAAQDGVFHPAIADIKEKDKVVAYHPDIKNPVSVRFAWHETAIPNLVNSEGLPAIQFDSSKK